jgi:hypothetical protein
MQAMQASRPNSPVDLVPAPPPSHQLPPRHDAMLDARKLRDRPVIAASPRKSGLYATFSELVGHPPIVPGKSAPMARTEWQLRPRIVPDP